MIGTAIIVNGRLALPDAATFKLDDTDAAYGYGCYETLKVRESRLYFADFHEERLLGSAEILGIDHDLCPGDVAAGLDLLVRENRLPECNVKVMLIGHQGRRADWYAFLLPPVIPPAAVYRQGADCLLFAGERHFPQAKSLSMLLSTVAYRLATSLACYDALLVNRRNQLTEGTRTNLFYLRPGEGEAIYTPPAADVLAGITRRTLIAALAEAGVRTVERPLSLDEALGGAFSLMVTSTSSRVIPVRSLRGPTESATPASVAGPVTLILAPELERVAAIYDDSLQSSISVTKLGDI